MIPNEQFLIKPDFTDVGSAATMEFQVGSVNALADAQYNSHLGAYQSAYGMYNYMRFNSTGEYVMHYPTGPSLVIQPHNSCAWTPQGEFRMAQKSISPYRMKVNVEQCYDELFDSTFERFIEYGSSDSVGMSEGGVALTDKLTRLILDSTTLGARATLTAGGLFTGAMSFTDNLPTSIRDAFTRSAAVGQGWITALRALKVQDSAKYAHLDDGLIVNGDISQDGEEFTGDIIARFDARVAASPKKLRSAVRNGGRGGFGGRNIPVWMVSPSMIGGAYDAYLDQGVATATNRPRITTSELLVANGRGGTTPLTIYMIDGIPLIPVQEVEVFSEYLSGTPHFEYLTLTGVIQLGGSFGAIPERGGANVAVRIQRSTRNEDLGKTTYLSHMLGAVGINDTDYISGSYRFNEPS